MQNKTTETEKELDHYEVAGPSHPITVFID